MDTKARRSSKAIIALVLRIIFHATVNRVRVIHLHQMFDDRHVSLFRCQGSTIFLAGLTSLRRAFFCVSLGTRNTDCLGVKRALPFHLTGR